VSTYEIGLLGDVTDADRDTLVAAITNLIADFDLEVGGDVMIRVGDSFEKRDGHGATVAAYFGGAVQADQGLARRAFASSLPVIPTIPAAGDFGALVPAFLQGTNGLRRRADDPEMLELAVALLECVGLLRRQRRVFVSYRRVESRNAAVQLHDLLSGRGFDVFLDTHDIRPGEPFQDVLWHRLCDSDVIGDARHAHIFREQVDAPRTRPRPSKRDPRASGGLARSFAADSGASRPPIPE
jgi:hypothetical protein